MLKHPVILRCNLADALLLLSRLVRFKPAFTEEEKADHFRIGLNYNKEAFKRHNKQAKDFATKIWLSSEALKSLRPDLKEQACIIDMTPPPPDRPWPMFITPPVKGFRLKDYVKKEKDTNSEFQI